MNEKGTKSPDEKPVLAMKRKSDWRKWLDKNHAKSSGVWLRLAKKDSGLDSVSRSDALDVALCYGWIDGQVKKDGDENTWLQKFTPRRPRSIWSKINTGKADALIKSGRMRPAGLAAIESAKSSGRWESAYQSWSDRDVPPELQAALDASPNAKAFFETLRGPNRYGVIFRVQTAKKAETRAKRIADFIARFEKGETLFGLERQAAAKKKAK